MFLTPLLVLVGIAPYPEPARMSSVFLTIVFILCGCMTLLGAEPGDVVDLSTRPGEDWGGFLGPAGDGRSSLVGMPTPWPDGGPRIVWQCELGDGYCGPAVARGRATAGPQ